jgi:hypothetical protein
MRPLFVDPKRIAVAVMSASERARRTDLAKTATTAEVPGALPDTLSTERLASRMEHQTPRVRRGIVMRACVAPRARRDALIAVMREPSQLPSLAAARVIAGLRARGDAVSVFELPAREFAQLVALGCVVKAGDLRWPSNRSAACVLAVDANDHIHALRVENEFNVAHLGHGLVPDFTDQSFSQMRWLPIAASGVAGESRPLAAVLHEIREYARRYALPNLIFVDDALNNNDNTFAALVETIQDHATGVQWMCTVRVGASDDDGLSRRLMRRAAIAGLREVTLCTTDACFNARVTELVKYAREAGIRTKCASEAQAFSLSPAAPRATRASDSFKQTAQPNTFVYARAAVPTGCIPLKD